MDLLKKQDFPAVWEDGRCSHFTPGYEYGQIVGNGRSFRGMAGLL